MSSRRLDRPKHTDERQLASATISHMLTSKSVVHVTFNVEKHPSGVVSRRAEAIQGWKSTEAIPAFRGVQSILQRGLETVEAKSSSGERHLELREPYTRPCESLAMKSVDDRR